MPNRCENTVTVSGKTEDLKVFLGKIRIDEERCPRLFESLYPTPEELMVDVGSFQEPKQTEMQVVYQRNREKYGSAHWYDWNTQKWGSKWGDYHTGIEGGAFSVLPETTGILINSNFIGESFSITFTYESAWSPHLEGWRHISTLFPALQFNIEYVEHGVGFCGAAYYQNGKGWERDDDYALSNYYEMTECPFCAEEVLDEEDSFCSACGHCWECCEC